MKFWERKGRNPRAIWGCVDSVERGIRRCATSADNLSMYANI